MLYVTQVLVSLYIVSLAKLAGSLPAPTCLPNCPPELRSDPTNAGYPAIELEKLHHRSLERNDIESRMAGDGENMEVADDENTSNVRPQGDLQQPNNSTSGMASSLPTYQERLDIWLYTEAFYGQLNNVQQAVAQGANVNA